MKHLGLILLGLLIVGVLLLHMVAFTVEYNEWALVKTFSETTRVIDGRDEAGLHWKWPWVQSVVKRDARTQVLADIATELNTSDKNNIILTLYCGWRIMDPNRFDTELAGGQRATEEAADRLTSLLQEAKSNMVGRHNLADFVSTDPDQRKQVQTIVTDEVFAPVDAEADKFGVKLVSVGIKSLGLAGDTSRSVIETQIQERQAEANKYREQGEADATAIRSRAQEAADVILTFADAKATDIVAEGEESAAQQYAAYREAPQLAAFLRDLESLREQLQGRSVILLTPAFDPAVRLFQRSPGFEDWEGKETGFAQAPRGDESDGEQNDPNAPADAPEAGEEQ
ncbi:MAG: SPFH domain-containing protein [Planctomycetota bacterium]